MNRIITVFIAVFFSVLLLSCSKNDDKDNGTNNPLIGTWYLVEQEGEPNLSDCNKESFYKFTESKVINKYFFGIKDNGGCEISLEVEYSYTIVGNKIKVSIDEETEELPFEIKDGILSLSFPDSDDSFYKEKFIKK